MGYKLGKNYFKYGLSLAPMAGVTDRAYRNICRRFGAEMTYTEMASAKALSYGDKTTLSLALLHENEENTSVQIFGHECDVIKDAVSAVCAQRQGYIQPLSIDINMGCPMKKIVGNGDGSALMKDPVLAGRLVSSVRQSTDLPVTVKIRAGWDGTSINAVQIAKIAEDSGADAICVHGRTREQMYCQEVNLDVIKDVKEAVNIPVVGNGGINTANDALKMLNYTGCDGLMLARGTMGNPWLFEEIKAKIDGKGYSLPPLDYRIQCALTQFEEMIADKGERTAVLEGRRQIAYYIKDVRGSANVRGKLNSAQSVDEVYSIINDFIKK